MISLSDSWSKYWAQENYFDNVTLSASNTATQISYPANIAPNSLSGNDLLDMQSSNSTVINTVNVFSNAIQLNWGVLDDSNYKVVIAKSDIPKEKFADITSDDTYTFVNLEPDTQYQIRSGIRADDSTQSVLEFTTLSTGVLPFVSGIDLSAVYNGDTVDLSWLDSNYMGENRYRVERAVNYGEYELTSLAPRFDTLISDDVEPHWDSISYKVFERLGTQKLYSDEIIVDIP